MSHPSPSLDPATRVMHLLGERWTFLILRQAFFGVRRFSQMHRNLGVSRNVLSGRLRMLVDNGILERRRYREMPDLYEYRLTEKGLELYPAILAITRWGDRHLPSDDAPPLRLRHATCGRQVDPELVCGHCGERIDAREIEIAAAPPIRTAPAAAARRRG